MSALPELTRPVEPADAPPALLLHGDELALRYRNARAAQRAWAKVPVAERARRLQPVIDALVHEQDAIADRLVAETGKHRVEAVGHEIAGALGTLTFLRGHAAKVLAPEGRRVGPMLHRKARVHPVPHGLVLVISPWNFPLAIPLGAVAHAVVAGNAVVLKPSEVTPDAGALIAALFARCDLPANLVQVVQGDGAVGAALIASGPDKVAFTGSVATGRKVMTACAAHPIPVDLELGGVDALIVCEDADLELASSAVVWGATFNGGQVCASVERVLVHQAIADRFVAAVLAKLEQIDPERDLGPVIFDRQAEVYARHLDDARRRGLQVRCGGAMRPDGRFEPTLIEGDGIEQSEVYREESFGPIVAVATFRSDAEAVRKHDATPFGLTASVYSRSIERAEAIAGQLRAGVVSINDVAASLHAYGEIPWGGVGASGFGRSHGPEGLRAMTRTRVIEQGRAGIPEIKRPWWYPYDPDQGVLIADFAKLLGTRRPDRAVRLLGRMGRSAAALFTRHPRL